MSTNASVQQLTSSNFVPQMSAVIVEQQQQQQQTLSDIRKPATFAYPVDEIQSHIGATHNTYGRVCKYTRNERKENERKLLVCDIFNIYTHTRMHTYRNRGGWESCPVEQLI